MTHSNPPKITGTRYVLAVKDLKDSAAYYQNQLGFTSVWTDGNWHFLSRELFFVMLGECKDDVSAFETNDHSYYAYIEMENVKTLYDEYQKRDVDIIAELKDKDWGQREFAIRTIDGHRIMFGETL
ncbi:VOC family protein [Gracilimonas sp.]|uniref:VOC family protein n=1 Tax=Gracilimonas sp. TaxID=1974203 RepID=UPI0032EE48F3